MKSTDTPPEDLSERKLFTEYVELLEQDTPDSGYTKMKLKRRRIALLSEIGDRLEELEATKAILCDDRIEQDQSETMTNGSSMEIGFDKE